MANPMDSFINSRSRQKDEPFYNMVPSSKEQIKRQEQLRAEYRSAGLEVQYDDDGTVRPLKWYDQLIKGGVKGALKDISAAGDKSATRKDRLWGKPASTNPAIAVGKAVGIAAKEAYAPVSSKLAGFGGSAFTKPGGAALSHIAKMKTKGLNRKVPMQNISPPDSFMRQQWPPTSPPEKQLGPVASGNYPALQMASAPKPVDPMEVDPMEKYRGKPMPVSKDPKTGYDRAASIEHARELLKAHPDEYSGYVHSKGKHYVTMAPLRERISPADTASSPEQKWAEDYEAAKIRTIEADASAARQLMRSRKMSGIYAQGGGVNAGAEILRINIDEAKQKRVIYKELAEIARFVDFCDTEGKSAKYRQRGLERMILPSKVAAMLEDERHPDVEFGKGATVVRNAAMATKDMEYREEQPRGILEKLTGRKGDPAGVWKWNSDESKPEYERVTDPVTLAQFQAGVIGRKMGVEMMSRAVDEAGPYGTLRRAGAKLSGGLNPLDIGIKSGMRRQYQPGARMPERMPTREEWEAEKRRRGI